MTTEKHGLFVSKMGKETVCILCVEGEVKLVDFINHDICRPGNIYIGVIDKIAKKIGAVFVYLDKINGFLKRKDIGNIKSPITNSLYKIKPHERILVQVQQSPKKGKSPKVSCKIKIVGTFIIFLAFKREILFSSSIDTPQRKRLKEFVKEHKDVFKGCGVIFRTASTIADSDQILSEMRSLKLQWKDILSEFSATSKSKLIYSGDDGTTEILAKTMKAGVNTIYCDSSSVIKIMHSSMKKLKNTYNFKIKTLSKNEMSSILDINSEINLLLKRKVLLPNGGYLYIDTFEAFTAVDFNSGKDTDIKKQQHTKSLSDINMEAIKSTVDHITKRNISGIIVLDTIDLRKQSDKQKIMLHLEKCMNVHPHKYTIDKVSNIGLIEMTRQRHGESLHERVTETCPHCLGTGRVKNTENTASSFLRALHRNKKIAGHDVRFTMHPILLKYLKSNNLICHVVSFCKEHCKSLSIIESDSIHENEVLYKTNTNNDKIFIQRIN